MPAVSTEARRAARAGARAASGARCASGADAARPRSCTATPPGAAVLALNSDTTYCPPASSRVQRAPLCASSTTRSPTCSARGVAGSNGSPTTVESIAAPIRRTSTSRASDGGAHGSAPWAGAATTSRVAVTLVSVAATSPSVAVIPVGAKPVPSIANSAPGRSVSSGMRVTVSAGEAPTTSTAWPRAVSAVAVIVAVPDASATSPPVASTVATWPFDVAHCTGATTPLP